MPAAPQLACQHTRTKGLRIADDVLPMRLQPSRVSSMKSGRLERLFSEGYVEGWAFDQQSPHRPLVVDIRAGEKTVVAQGLANIYREDLENERLGLGWCAFRLRLTEPATELIRDQLTLYDNVSGLRMNVSTTMLYVLGNPYVGSHPENVATFDPFVTARISQLRACEDLFAHCLRSRGAAVFVRTAYIYMLGRSADLESLAIHTEMVAKGSLTPLRLLEVIAETTEYRAGLRELAAPNAPGFPFVEATNA
jgi:hypothetical protein